MAESVVKRRREALKDFLTVMVALTEASGEIAKAFWNFLEFEPPERDAKFLSFHTHSDNERLLINGSCTRIKCEVVSWRTALL